MGSVTTQTVCAAAFTSRRKGSVTSTQKGFTLIEILVVIGIIAILAAIVIVAINPARQFAQARESQRLSNVDAILDAIGQRMADNKGQFAATGSCPAITTSTSTIENGPNGTDANALDLATNCLVPTYISSLPVDPSNPPAPSTGYTVSVDANGRTMVCAPDGFEQAIAGSEAICVTR